MERKNMTEVLLNNSWLAVWGCPSDIEKGDCPTFEIDNNNNK